MVIWAILRTTGIVCGVGIVAVGVLTAAFVYIESFGAATTRFIIRQVMPSPEKYRNNAQPHHSREQPVYKDRKEMLRDVDWLFRPLRVEGRCEFAIVSDPACSNNFPFLFHRPSVTKYGPHQWLWDSCFHIMANSHRIASSSAKSEFLCDSVRELLSLFSMQNVKTGFIPEMIYWHPDPNQHGIGGFMFGYSDPQGRFTDITQMPMIAYPIERIFNVFQRLEFLAKIDKQDAKLSSSFLRMLLPRALNYFEWWIRARDPNKNGLVAIVHPWESGLDASPLYDPVHGFFFGDNSPDTTDALRRDTPPNPKELYPKFIELLYRYRHKHNWNIDNAILPSGISSGEVNRFDVEDIGVNAVLADNFRIIADLAARDEALRPLHEPASRAHLSLSAAIFSQCLEQDQEGHWRFVSFGWSPQLRKMIKLTATTVQMLLPLLLIATENDRDEIAGALLKTPFSLKFRDHERSAVSSMLKDVLDDVMARWVTNEKEFWTAAPMPTTAKSSDAFDPNDSALMWRGPTWPTTNWFMFQLLNRIAQGEQSASYLSPKKWDGFDQQFLLKWEGVHLMQGFSEYFNPLNGEPLGQRGLGMSMSLADVLHFHQNVSVDEEELSAAEAQKRIEFLVLAFQSGNLVTAAEVLSTASHQSNPS